MKRATVLHQRGWTRCARCKSRAHVRLADGEVVCWQHYNETVTGEEAR